MTQLDKGGQAEELLREYFLSLGYYVVRSLCIKIDRADITDVDIWLYMRSSTVSRERINVDAKNKTSPKALERIFWAKGVQSILNLDGCMVATTDKRELVKEFGRQHNVTVLDGEFLLRLAKAGLPCKERLSEEEFLANCFGEPDSNMLSKQDKDDFQRARSLLLTKLNFDGCNSWLHLCGLAIDKALKIPALRPAATRVLYASISMLLIGIDYSARLIQLEDRDTTRKRITESLRYGENGFSRMQDTVNTAIKMMEAYTPEVRTKGTQLSLGIRQDMESIPAEILGEMFSKIDIARELFSTAKSFESLAYRRTLVSPSQLDPQLSAILFGLLDFFKIDRLGFLDQISSGITATSL